MALKYLVGSFSLLKTSILILFFPVKSRLGPRELKNPLGFTKFEFNSVDEAEKAIDATQEVEMDESDSAAAALEGLAVSNVTPSGGAIGKFNKKSKKKKKNKPKF